jgi:hypothetical protein
MTGPARIPEDVVGAANAIQHPSGSFQFPDQVGAFHRAYYTHNHIAGKKSVGFAIAIFAIPHTWLRPPPG